jgi:hypothetical protein
MTRTLSTLALLFAAPVLADPPKTVTVTGGKTDQAGVVCAVKLPDGEQRPYHYLSTPDGKIYLAQTAKPALLDPQNKAQYAVFVVPELKAGQTLNLTVGPAFGLERATAYKFTPEKDGQTDLVLADSFGAVKVLSYFHPKHDPKDHYYTFKPFHNVFDRYTPPGLLLTNSSAKTDKDGQFPHHRGLFFGFNRITYGDKKTADIWHGKDNVYAEHDEMLSTEAGMIFGRHRAAISWHGKDGQTFASEQREVTVTGTGGVGTLIDWSTVLSTKLDKVRLDGDPQHAGFHFRASQEVSKNGKENTYYLRPDGKGKPGEFRNWDAKAKDPRTVNLPWNALSMVVGGKRYTVLRINHPDNPKETRGSERDYGRFGDYFEYDLTPDKPLKLRYRMIVQQGEMTVEQCEKLAAAFVTPPETKAK